MKEINEEKADTALRTGTKIQPYIVFIEVDGQVLAHYVVINNYFYKVESSLKAVDICFKSFFAFDLNYMNVNKCGILYKSICSILILSMINIYLQ